MTGDSVLPSFRAGAVINSVAASRVRSTVGSPSPSGLGNCPNIPPARYPPVMHEASVVANMVDAVLGELEKYDVIKVNAVNIVVGDLTQLGCEQMRFAYEVLSEGTALKGSALVIEREPIVLRCRKCGFEGPPKEIDLGTGSAGHNIPVIACPECGGPVEVTSGESCAVRDIDIEAGEGE